MAFNLANATTNRKGLLAKLSGSTSDVLRGDGTFGTFAGVLAALTRFKVGSFTRDISLASGTQAVTGVGFPPKAVMFLQNATTAWNSGSIGVDDATTAGAIANNNGVSAGTWITSTTNSIVAQPTSSDNAVGKINSMDADGFTVGWTKTGSPTGTTTINYLAFR